MTCPLSVAILCGGESRRMGIDKALLPLVETGPPLLELVIDRVRDMTDNLYLVGVPRPGYDRFGPPLVADEWPGNGPLGGIATALRHAEHSACLVVACDMPFLNPQLLEFMALQPRASFDVLVPLIPGETTTGSGPLVFQPLHAIYRQSCLPAIQARLAAGERRVTGFYGDVRTRTVTERQIRAFDPLLRSFMSINTPEALGEARAWPTGSSPSQ